MNATIISNNDKHYPVLLDEILSIISPQNGGTFIDCTFGQGGYSNDYVLAESQDSSLGTNFALNNANFMTPPDGQNPRMQMYIYEKSDNPYDLFTVNFPDFLAGNYEVNPANGWGGEVTSEPITGNIEHVDDGTINGHLGCEDLTNDLFEIRGINDRFGLRIYNRWGNILYDQKPYENNWDGLNMKGNNVINGTYYYILTNELEEIERNGSFVLQR